MNPILPEEMRNIVELLEFNGLPDDARRLGLYLDQQERAEQDREVLEWIEDNHISMEPWIRIDKSVGWIIQCPEKLLADEIGLLNAIQKARKKPRP